MAALFVTANGVIGGKEEVRKRGMEFVGRCWILIQTSASLQEDFNAEHWRSVIGVFEIVGKERLFLTSSIRGAHIDATSNEHRGELALSEARDKAIEMLESTSTSSKGKLVEWPPFQTNAYW